MFGDKALHCDCGYRLRGRTEERQVAEVRRHASEAHGISFSAEEALAVLLRFALEPDEGAAARLAMVEDPTRRKDQR
jgi:predicted small metal-binding protein